MANPLRIFLVDDDMVITRITEQILLKNNYEIAGIAHGPDVALKEIPKAHADIVLMDVNIGIHSGIEVAAQLNKENLTRIIFVTGITDQKIQNELLDPEYVYGVVYKPFKPHELIAQVKYLQNRVLVENQVQKRVKELGLGNATLDILFNNDESLNTEQLLQKVADILPLAWQYPEHTVAAITYDGKRFESQGFQKTKWQQRALFKTIVGTDGFVEICYTEEFPIIDDGPFLKEERNLITNISNIIVGFLNTISGKQALSELEEKKQRLEQTSKLLAETNKVAKVGGWELNLETKSLFWSDLTKKIHGVDDSFIPDLNTAIACYKEGYSRETIQNAVQKLISSGEPFQHELQIITKQGEEKWVRAQGEAECKDGKCIRIYGAFQDIDENKKSELSQIRRKKIDEAIIRLRESVFKNEERENYFETLLADVLEVAQSEYGFIGDVLYDDQDKPYLKTYAMSNLSWNEDTEKRYEENKGRGMEFRNLDTLFGESMKTGKPIIANNPAHHSKAKGVHVGHPALNAFLGIPVIHLGEMIAFVGIANRPEGYDEDIVKELKPLIETIGQVIYAAKKDEEIKQKDEHLDRISKTIPGVLLTYKLSSDGNVTILYVNESIENLFGISVKEVMNNPITFLSTIHPEDLEYVSNAIFESAKNLSFFNEDIRVCLPGQPERWVSLYGMPTRLPDQSTRWDLIVLDITEEKKLIQALDDGEKKYREMVELMSEGLVIHKVGERNEILDCNHAACKILGLTKQQLMGLDSFHPQWRAINEDGTPAKPEEHPAMVTMRTGKPVRNKVMGVHKNEKDLSWLLINSQPVFDDKTGNLKNVLVSFNDITEIREAEKELIRSQKQVKALIDSQTNYVLRTDMEGKITYVNRAYEQTYKLVYDEGPMIGQSSMSGVMPYDHEKVQALVYKCVTNPNTIVQIEIDKQTKKDVTSVRTTLWEFICLTDEDGNPSEIQCMGIDISDRIQFEKALQKSEKRFREMAENAPIFIAVHRKDYSSEYLNRAWREFFDLDSYDLSNRKIYEHLHPDERAYSYDQFKESLDKQIPFQMEYRLRNSKGEYRWIINYIVPIIDENEAYNGFLSTANDITTIKEAEFALTDDNERLEVLVKERTKEQEELNIKLQAEIENRKKIRLAQRETQKQIIEAHRQLKSITENISEVVYRSTADKLVYANPSIVPLFGYDTMEELFARSINDLYASAKARQQFIRYAARHKEWQNYEMEFKRKDGSTFVALLSGIAKVDKEGQIVSIDGTIRDISEIKNAQKELVRKESDLLQAQNIARLGSWTLYVGAEKQLVWDETKYRPLGMEQIHPMPYTQAFLDRIHPEDVKLMNIVAQEALEKGFSEFEIRIIENETLKYISGTIRIHKQDIKEVILFGVSRDVTIERIAEIELEKARQQAEKLADTKQNFLANMSHEIRTPINGIRGMTYLLQQSELEEDQKSFVQSIYQSSDHLLGIVNEILDFSKLESDKLTYEKKSFNIRDIIQSVFIMVESKIKEKGLNLFQDIRDNIPEYVIGDSHRLTQIIANLLDNAVKFTDAGQIQLTAELESRQKNECLLTVKVQDTGCGIPEERLKEIFDMFIQSDSTISRRYGGTGLGLAIVKKLCEQQGGTIDIASVEGEGTTFTFSLPFGIPEKAPAPVVSKRPLSSTSTKKPKLPKLHILIVDDNKTNRLWVNKVLEMWGAKTDEAENGLVALQKAQKTKYDAILMDIFMPEMDGLEATEKIRALNEHYKNASIIGLTADVLDNFDVRYMKSGLDICLGKPVNPDELLEALFDTKSTKDKSDDSENNSVSDLFDFSAIDDIADGDETFKLHIIKESVVLFGEVIPDLERAIASQKLVRSYQVIHKLKPNLEYLGLQKLIALSTSFIQQYKKGTFTKWIEAEPFLKEILVYLKKAYPEIKKLGDSS